MRLALFLPLLLLWPRAAAVADDGPPPPNIVMIVADDQGYHDLGCYGNAEAKTPNLDRLASQGYRGTSFYVTAPACTPSRSGFLTGRYPQRNGLYDMIRNDMINYGYRYTWDTYAISPEMTLGLDLREVLLPQPLKEIGYTTAIVGKWDDGRAKRYLPQQRGFDYFYGFANTGIDYWTHERYGVPSLMKRNKLIYEKGYATDLFGREAVAFIRKNRDRPFFLYAPFNAPHMASTLDKKSGGEQAPERNVALFAPMDPKAKRTIYLAMNEDLDEAVGGILSTLKDLGLEENTLVIYFSDNGATPIGSNHPLRGFKAQVFEGGFREPFLARWPGHIPAGAVGDDFLTSLEIFPTFLAVTGADKPTGDHLDGFNMLPVLEGKAKSSRTEMYWRWKTDRAARIGNWKWVDSTVGKGLFDLGTDIGESQDLSAEQPDVLASVKAKYAAWEAQMEDADPRGPFRDY